MFRNAIRTFIYIVSSLLRDLSFRNAVEWRFFEPSRQTKSGMKSLLVREIVGKITVLD